MPVIEKKKNSEIAFCIVSTQKPQEIIRDLNEISLRIEESLSDENIWYRVIDLSGTWNSSEEFYPWTEINYNAWIKLALHSEVLDDLRAWFGTLEKLLIRFSQEGHAIPMMETDEAAFGEVPLSILAVMYSDFVPIYTRFLDLWEAQDRNQCCEIVTDIVKSHGAIIEVEDLLVKLVSEHSYDNSLIPYLRTELENIYDDFPQSALFRKMVEVMHAKEAENIGFERSIFRYCSDWVELTESANAILAELES
ncbi:hypothetical protein I3J13_02380 [Agrobacterium sp. MOPV5]|uniref:hypothetical protein n=1 Tax=Agrobacterium leguminum TaxID=2792015 RepID=UPI0018C2BD76|nr:hypothetical protein [Agrobacterium leguminum]MBG0507597.1 hypothetical protein [Agrobacterium leguminum]